MTKKYYKAFAATLSKMRERFRNDYTYGDDIINAFEVVCVEQFAKDNPHFNAAKFREAAR